MDFRDTLDLPRPSSRTVRWLTPLALACAAAGCATPLAIQPGTPQAEVQARFGTPKAVYSLDEGSPGTRYEYDTGRWGQHTYMVDFGPDGRAEAVHQVLTDQHFATIKDGVDTTATIRREFGNPVHVVRYGLAGLTSWEYAYKQDQVWNSLLSIEFDDAGIVRKTVNGPDPAFEYQGDDAGGRGGRGGRR